MTETLWLVKVTIAKGETRLEWEIGAGIDEAREIAAVRWGVPIVSVASVLDANGYYVTRVEQRP